MVAHVVCETERAARPFGLALRDRAGDGVTPGHSGSMQPRPPLGGAHRFLRLTATQVRYVFRNKVSSSGLLVIASTNFTSACRRFMLWATTSPPGRTNGRSLLR